MFRLRLPLATAVIAVLVAPAAPCAAAPPSVLARLSAARVAAHDLQPAGDTASFGTRFYRFQQMLGGLPVLGAQVVVSDAGAKGGDLLIDGSRPGLPRAAADVSPTVGKASARAEAARLTRVGGDRSSAGLVVLPQGEMTRTVWRVVQRAGGRGPAEEILLDAQTGALLSRRSMAVAATGFATVFDPNPVTAYGYDPGFSDDDDADSDLLTGALQTVGLERLHDDTDCLEGRWVWATTRRTLQSDDVCNSARDWTDITRGDSEFEALMAYYHIDRTQQYIQNLGFTDVDNRQQRVRANDMSDDNSNYNPGDKIIRLGTGGVDDGEDAEVIVHEYGHSIQADQVPGGFIAIQVGDTQYGPGGAMGEGFGDYLAASQSKIFSGGRSSGDFEPGPECVMEWDALFNDTGGCLRRVDGRQTLSTVTTGTGCDFEVHCAGALWSATLWDIRRLMSGADADRVVIQSQFALPRDAGLDDGVAALLAADMQLYGGVHQTAMKRVFTRRGLLAGSACTTPRRLGASFIIDDSGSMLSSDPQMLRGTATQVGLDQLPDDSMASASLFSSSISTIFDPTPLTAANRDELKALVAGAVGTLYGGTEYGLAFGEASRQVDLMDGADRRAVIFLSDGAPGDPGYTTDLELAAKDVPIYTIGFASAPNDELQAIADRSGGEAYTVQSPGEAQIVFARIVSALNCDRPQSSEHLTLAPAEAKAIPFDVAANEREMRVLAAWSSGSAKAALRRPDGSVLDASSAREGESVVAADTYASFKVPAPDAGPWRLEIVADPANESEMTVDADVWKRQLPVPPDASVTSEPAEGASLPARPVRFTWLAARGAESYDVEVDGVTVASALTDQTTQIAGLATGAHRWRVVARNSFGTTASEERHFSIEAPRPSQTGAVSGTTSTTPAAPAVPAAITASAVRAGMRAELRSLAKRLLARTTRSRLKLRLRWRAAGVMRVSVGLRRAGKDRPLAATRASRSSGGVQPVVLTITPLLRRILRSARPATLVVRERYTGLGLDVRSERVVKLRRARR